MNERAKLQELLKANEERLYELRLKEARMGRLALPVHYITEISETEEEIHKLESQISSYDNSSVASNDISKVVCDTIEQLKRLGTGGKVTICVLEIHVSPTGS